MSSLIVWPSWPPPEPLANPLYSAASPGLPVNTIFQGDFYSLAGCTAHISFSASCKHTHTAKSSFPSFSDVSFQLFHLVAFNMLHLRPLFPRPREGHFLSTSPVAPFWGKSCLLCQKWLCPIFNLWEAVNQSYFLGEAHTYTAPCLPQMSFKLIHPCRRALQWFLLEGEHLCPEMVCLWDQVSVVTLWSKPVLTLRFPPSGESEKQKEGCRTERMRPVMVWSAVNYPWGFLDR